MSAPCPRIALLGGIPPTLGGGGLEIQRHLTAQALISRGCRVIRVEAQSTPAAFDVLHVFGSEPDAWHMLQHWRRNPAPLVISPVLVLKPGWSERRLVWTSKLKRPLTLSRMRRELLRRADLLVALTEREASLLRKLAPEVETRVIGNGVTDLRPSKPDLATLGIEAPYVLLLGTVSRRKRQVESLRALVGSRWRAVIVGGFQGGQAERGDFERAVVRSDAVWLGEVSSPDVVRGLLQHAHALVHFSESEGQSLAVLESLHVGTPVICSDIPSNVELAATYPGWVHICHSATGIRAALEQARARPATTPSVPTWDDIAASLEGEYARLRLHRN